jgi:hypothetical protein
LQGGVLLRHTLQAVTDDSGQIQENLRSDPRVASLNPLKEALVDGKDLDGFGSHRIGTALKMANESPFRRRLHRDHVS